MEVFDAAPGITVLDHQLGEWERAKSRDAMVTMLQKYPDIDAVWASDDDMALGVEDALNQVGGREGLWVLGGAGMKDIVKRVMENDPLIPADITYPPAMIAAGIHIAAGKATGATAEQVFERIPPHLGMNAGAGAGRPGRDP